MNETPASSGHPVTGTIPRDTVLPDILALVRAKHHPLKIRAVLGVWHPAKQHYVNWPGKVWRIALLTAEEARAFAETMETLFDCLSVARVEVVLQRVQEMKADLVRERQ